MTVALDRNEHHSDQILASLGKTEAAAAAVHGESATDASIVLSFCYSSIHLLPYIRRSTLVIKKDKQTTLIYLCLSPKAKLSPTTIALVRVLAEGKRQ